MLRPLRDAVTGWSPRTAPSSDPLAAIAFAWASIVGERVAANAWPHELRGDSLLVATRSSAWSQELHLLAPRILAGLAALPVAPAVRELRFRTGLRRRVSSTPAAAPPSQRPSRRGPPPEPAADLADALANVRRRVTLARRAAAGTCADCGAPVAAATARCAACVIAAEGARDLALDRALFAAPWLDAPALATLVPGISSAAFERSRRRLLARWWSILQRALRTGTTGADRFEHQIASSYVLLQSGLPPERVTPAVVRNVLGDDLTMLLWPDESPENRASAAKNTGR